jgi:hypothetical protein
MAIYSTVETISGPKAPPGSVMARLGIDPAIGFAVIDRSRVPADLVRFVDEYDAALGTVGRETARARRLAAERDIEQNELREAIKYLEATKAVPAGFAVVQHPDSSFSMSIGVGFGGGFVMVRTGDLELVTKSFGYRLADWPNPIVLQAEPHPLPNALPAVPLVILKHPDGVETTLGHSLGGGYRIVTHLDYKQRLFALGWRPSAWAPSP